MNGCSAVVTVQIEIYALHEPAEWHLCVSTRKGQTGKMQGLVLNITKKKMKLVVSPEHSTITCLEVVRTGIA